MQQALEPAYMRIRRYILTHLYKSDGQAEKIMSENELCNLFGVSRVTVRSALKKLVEEKYLITRKGSGTSSSTPTPRGDPFTS